MWRAVLIFKSVQKVARPPFGDVPLPLLLLLSVTAAPSGQTCLLKSRASRLRSFPAAKTEASFDKAKPHGAAFKRPVSEPPVRGTLAKTSGGKLRFKGIGVYKHFLLRDETLCGRREMQVQTMWAASECNLLL
ncbi:unnamed protein product [Pleuronectes platessa]|uniref:Uncharacterized protein n=1 Tax=Pleuronectes platessa TaxID=8262 RepID=A0A9N7UMW4_PLEPL|nr:unnamed protein product [Pleuronectes platessa]